MSDSPESRSTNEGPTALTLSGAIDALRNDEGNSWVTLREVDARVLADELDRLTARLAAVTRERDLWLQVWDNVKLDNPDLREDNKPLAVAATYALLTARNAELVKALDEAQRDAQRWRLARQYVSAMTVEGWQKMLDDGHAPSEEGNSVADDAVDQMIARAALKESAT